MATIVDVARIAGVSVSTVSHVVNGTRNVNAGTAASVHAAIAATGYSPNMLARSLVRSATNSVGIAISTSTNSYFMDIICAIEEACAAQGQMVFLSDTKDDPDTELAVVKALHNRRVDGIILAPSADPEQRAIAYLRDNKVPCVLVDRLTASDIDQVGVENREAMQALVEHLISLGHSRIGMVAGQPNFETTNERILGYRLAMAKHNLAVNEAWIFPGNPSVAAATASTKKLLQVDGGVTAIATGNNLATIGAVRALSDAKLRVPDDIALASFDDFEWADFFEPRLTVMAQPCEDIGRRAAELLAQRIKIPDAPIKVVRLKPKLIIRRSCGTPITSQH